MSPRDHVAHAADRADRVGAQLPAQVVDVHLDRVALHLVAPAVQPFLQLRLGQRRAGTFQQCRQQREFPVGKVDRHPVAGHRARDGIEREIAVVQHVVAARDIAAQQRPHSRRELVETERFHEVVVGAGIETRDAVGHGVAGRQDQHAHLVARAAHFLEELEPALLRKAEIEQDQRVRAVRGVERQAPGLSILDPVDGVAVLLQARQPASCRSWGRLRPGGCASGRCGAAGRR